MSKKKFLIDMTSLSEIPKKSQDIYAVRLVDGYMNLQTRNFEPVLLVRERSFEYLRNRYPDLEIRIIESNWLEKKIFRLINYDLPLSFKWKKAIKISETELVLCPYTDIFHYYKSPIHKIQVIHDIYGKYVASGIRKIMFRCLTPLLIRNADSIITISNYVKQSIIDDYTYKHKKYISVIYNSIPPITVLEQLPKDNFILYVSTLQKYKNIFTLLEAFDKVNKKYPSEFKLVIVGKSTKYWENYCIPFIEQHSLSNQIIHLSNISDNHLSNLYKQTLLFVSPSLFEGFGYTPIEAAIHKAPVLTSKCGAIEEVTCQKVKYYNNPLDSDELADAIISILDNPPTKLELENISTFFAEKYSLENQANAYDNILKTIIN